MGVGAECERIYLRSAMALDRYGEGYPPGSSHVRFATYRPQTPTLILLPKTRALHGFYAVMMLIGAVVGVQRSRRTLSASLSRSVPWRHRHGIVGDVATLIRSPVTNAPLGMHWISVGSIEHGVRRVRHGCCTLHCVTEEQRMSRSGGCRKPSPNPNIPTYIFTIM